MQDFSEAYEDSSEPEFILTSHKCKAVAAVRESPQKTWTFEFGTSVRKNWGL